MRLISCHIEHFGKWSDQTFSFEDGCNVLCEDNGWGKSMLAAFIRTMFYGFAGGKLRDDLQNERKRYQPWQGGVCGGSLRFEAGGNVYELTRIFGAKEKEDKFELRDAQTNLRSEDYSENIGEELFGIDRASFCRTVFITQNDCQTEATDGVNAKLGNLSGERDDLMSFESVNQRLTDLINQQSPTRKTGELYRKRAELAALKDQVSYGPATDRDILAEQEQKDALEAEQSELKAVRSSLMQRQQALFVCKERLIKKKQYETLCHEEKEREEDLCRCRGRFPGELPDEAELTRYIGECSNLIAEKKAVEMFGMTEEDLSQLQQDKQLFSAGRPSDDVLAQKNEQADRYRQLRWERSSGRPTAEEERQLLRYEELLGPTIPDRSELRAVEEDWRLRASGMSVLITKNDYRHRMEAQAKAKAQEELQRQQTEKKNALFRALIGEGIAVIALIVGIVLWAGSEPGTTNWIAVSLFTVAVIVAVLGILGIRQTVAMKVEEDPVDEDAEIAALKSEIEVAEQMAAEVERNTEEYLKQWNREYREDRVLFELAKLSGEAEEYEKLREKADHYRESRIDERIGALQRELEEFVKTYHPEAEIAEETCDEWLETLKRERDRYNDLRERKRRHEEAQKKYRAHHARITEYISALGFKVQGDMPRQLQSIQTDLQQYRLRSEELEKAVAKREAFAAVNDLAEILRPVDMELLESEEKLAEQLEQTENRLEELRKLIHQKEDLLDELREKRDSISAAEEVLELRQEEYRELDKHHRMLKKTKELLEKAKTSFTARYTEPIMSGFGKYYQMLTGKEAVGCYLDADLKLTVSEQGLQREPKFFSEGWKDLLSICMRMALVDAMYREEKPVVIFDDPFVNLDREKTEAALKFMEEIGKEYQVIYFTCHESRTVG